MENDKSSSWLNKWDQRYAGQEFVFGREPNQFLKENTEVLPQGKVLCAGDGEGRNGVWLARNGFDVTAIDYSSVGLEKARKLGDQFDVGLNLVEANILEHNFTENHFSAIVNVYLHMTSQEISALHHRYRKWLKPGGVFLAEVYSKDQLQYSSGGPKSIDALYQVDYFERDFGDYEKVYLKKEIVNLSEGQGHIGEASVIRAIFRKPVE